MFTNTDVNKTLVEEVRDEIRQYYANSLLKYNYHIELLEQYYSYTNQSKRFYERVRVCNYIIFREIEEIFPNLKKGKKFYIDTKQPISSYYEQIKKLYYNYHMKQDDIATMYGINQGTVSKIVNNKLREFYIFIFINNNLIIKWGNK